MTSIWENQPSEGDVKVVKTDDAGNVMAGVRFTLTGTSDLGNAVSRNCTTGSNGECTVLNVEIGTYTLAEDVTTLPAGYGGASSQQVTVAAGTLVTKTFTNPRLHKVIVVVCHEGTNTLAPSAVTLGSTHNTISAPPTIAGATPAAVQAALCGLQGFGGKGHETVAPSVNVGSAAHN